MTGVTLAVPCRTDEPGLGRTLDLALASWRRSTAAAGSRLEVLVCLNGAGGDGPRAHLRAFAQNADGPLVEHDADFAAPAPAAPAGAAVTVEALMTRRAGKPIAWNVLRAWTRTPLAVFADADVSFTPDAVGTLLSAFAARPDAVLASARTTCAPRPGTFERIMAAPYAVTFPNLSPQLYAARLAGLPRAMPEDLLEPERWLELLLGPERIVRATGAHVVVRLPGTLGDFFRQRVRIEMGKVQIARQYPALRAGGAPQPGVRDALSALGLSGSARLGVYVALRSLAHAIAWWRWRRGRTAGVWRQATTTKRWDGA